MAFFSSFLSCLSLSYYVHLPIVCVCNELLRTNPLTPDGALRSLETTAHKHSQAHIPIPFGCAEVKRKLFNLSMVVRDGCFFSLLGANISFRWVRRKSFYDCEK